MRRYSISGPVFFPVRVVIFEEGYGVGIFGRGVDWNGGYSAGDFCYMAEFIVKTKNKLNAKKIPF